MAAPYIRIDEKALQKKMQKYEAIVGKEVAQLVRNGSRLLCVELAGFTFPKDKKLGEAAISRDVSKIFTALNPDWWKKHTKKKAFRVVEADDFLAQLSTILVKNITAAKTFHKANRVFSRGRALPINKKAVIQMKTRNSLVRGLQKKVGLCKAGWAVAASQCKADVRQPLRGIPAWVTRNMGKAVAAVREQSVAGMSFKINLTNKINYTDKLLSRKSRTIAQNVARGKFVKMLNTAIRATKKKEAGLK